MNFVDMKNNVLILLVNYKLHVIILH